MKKGLEFENIWSSQKIAGEKRKGMLVEKRPILDNQDDIDAYFENLERPMRDQVEENVDAVVAEAKQVAELHAYSSTLDFPDRGDRNGAVGPVGVYAEPNSKLAFAYKIEDSARLFNRYQRILDTEGLAPNVMEKIYLLADALASMVDGQRLLQIADLEREALSGRGKLKKKNGKPKAEVIAAVRRFYEVAKEYPDIGVTKQREMVGAEFGVSGKTISRYVGRNS